MAVLANQHSTGSGSSKRCALTDVLRPFNRYGRPALRGVAPARQGFCHQRWLACKQRRNSPTAQQALGICWSLAWMRPSWWATRTCASRSPATTSRMIFWPVAPAASLVTWARQAESLPGCRGVAADTDAGGATRSPAAPHRSRVSPPPPAARALQPPQAWRSPQPGPPRPVLAARARPRHLRRAGGTDAGSARGSCGTPASAATRCAR